MVVYHTRLRQAAAMRRDQKILLVIQSESSLISREVHYHKLCYVDYTRQSTLDKSHDKVDVGSAVESTFPHPPTSVNIAHNKLFQQVRNHIFDRREATTMTALTQVCNSALTPDDLKVSNLGVKRLLVARVFPWQQYK